VSERTTASQPPENDAAVAEEFFETNNPALEEIEMLTVAEIQSESGYRCTP
jgi:hypothetical protein